MRECARVMVLRDRTTFWVCIVLSSLGIRVMLNISIINTRSIGIFAKKFVRGLAGIDDRKFFYLRLENGISSACVANNINSEIDTLRSENAKRTSWKLDSVLEATSLIE